MITTYLTSKRFFWPLVLLVLFNGQLFSSKYSSCLAIRYSDKRDNDDWEPLFGRSSKHHISVNERSHENQRQLDYLLALSRETDRLDEKSLYDNDDAAIDQLSKSSTDNRDWPVDKSDARLARLQSDEQLINSDRSKRRNDALFLTIVALCSLVGVLGLVAAAIFWYKIQKRAEAALDAEYPSYGVTGPGGNGTKISPNTTMSDRKLAQSAQMFHYQQQRQQMMAQEKAHLDNKPAQSDDSDDEIPNGGDYTVYECPGLAPTGEMEVRNPLFTEPDSSPIDSHPTTNNHYPQPTTVTASSSPPKEKSLQ